MSTDDRLRSTKRRLLVTGGAVFALVLVVATALFVFPVRTWLDQRHDLGEERARLELLRQENAQLESEAGKLQTDAEVERLARERFGLVRPGEDAYAILPAPSTTAPSASSAPTPTTPPSTPATSPASTTR